VAASLAYPKNGHDIIKTAHQEWTKQDRSTQSERQLRKHY
jgi:hypothetical protein